ncbi:MULTISPECIES: hypothetical protein [unclassified Clostridium]|uniref:hypothetical protein n=1 Tax=unclassified Clostridium TaxID=2614128 RepID=UPI0018995B1D|nr:MULTISPECIES: hypothetical protein [unclassified Clostridium]MCR1950627.1 hypothetical protein [Clostridium sp. DSM 100503]
MPTKPNSKKIYLPNERTGYAPEKHSLVSHGKVEGPSSPLPSTVEDDIVVNNIAYMEFDYTEQPEVDLEIDTNAPSK